ncbi:MAG: hypothetical protein B6241_04635 [Spirochaetaceae bacterium 4572_59]|nr:MAG: hypothetical protein B6241_04635 [Spirochaetaceae bacterium 4572_59]
MMNPFMFSRLVALSDGYIFGKREQFVEPTGICIDSREVVARTLFVSLKGERTDGHLHIESALQQGSCAVLVNRDWADCHLESINNWSERYGAVFFPVDDTLKKMQLLAENHRKRFTSMTIIGVTGSNGKTTSKEMIASILGCYKPTYKNPGNLNSEIGLPLTVLRMKNVYDYAVLEMGISHIGEMDVLARIARPEIAIVTNIGRAHIGFMGSQRKIAEEKRKVFSFFDSDSTAFIYENEGFGSILTEHLQGNLKYFGEKSVEGLQEVRDRGLEGQELVFTDYTISLSLPGRHNLQNALAAISVAQYLAVPPEFIQKGLSEMTAVFGRTEILNGKVSVIQDCYNANPDSVLASVKMAVSLPTKGRRILVLGDMLELGEESEAAHAALGSSLVSAKADQIFLFGPEMKAAANTVLEEREDVVHCSDFQELKSRVLSYVKEGDLVLLKGSRGMELERLTQELTRS